MNSIAILLVVFAVFVPHCIAHGHRSRKARSAKHYRPVTSRNFTHGRTVYAPKPKTTEAPDVTDVPGVTEAPTVPPTVGQTDAPTSPVTNPGSPPPGPPAGPDMSKGNEGFFVGLVDKFIPDDNKQYNKPYYKKPYYKKPYEKKQYKKPYEYKKYKDEKKNEETCYEIITSDNPYSSNKDISFHDISTSGRAIPFTSSSASATQITVTGSYTFFDEAVPSTFYVSTSGNIVLDPNSGVGSGADAIVPNLGNSAEKPFSVIAPFWSAWQLGTGSAVYVLENAGTLTIQWNVVELDDTTKSGVFQLRLTEGCSDVVFAYQTLSCTNPVSGTAQFGVKPAQGMFPDGQRSSLRMTSCYNGSYKFPRDSTGVWLKTTKCGNLIGQTGIRKQDVKKTYKKEYYKKDGKYNKYNKYDDQYCDVEDYFNHFLDKLFYR